MLTIYLRIRYNKNKFCMQVNFYNSSNYKKLLLTINFVITT